MIQDELIANQEEDLIDEYVLGIQNPSQLIGSLALLLREKNYVCLYDTSILSSPEQYLKKNNFEVLNKDFLYKWFLFFTGVHRNIKNFSNLILIPEVAEEICNLINGILSAIEKRKAQFKALSPHEKEDLQDIFEQLLKNEDILQNLLNTTEELRGCSCDNKQVIFQNLLDLVKFLNDHLELKKPSSRKVNDTDERIAAQTLYEVLVNNFNVAVYTRDDDIRKLISTTFRLLVSNQISEDPNLIFLRNLSHLNILVLKYNYEKKSFSRFFESSTLPHTGEFRFPRKINQNKISQIIPEVRKFLQNIQDALSKEEENLNELTNKFAFQDNSIKEVLEKSFQLICTLKIYEDTENVHTKIQILENFHHLAELLQCDNIAEEIGHKTKRLQKNCIQGILEELTTEKIRLEKVFEEISSQDKTNIEYWQKIQSSAQEMQENLLRIRFFESALAEGFYQVDYVDYDKFKNLLDKFKQVNVNIDTKGTPVSTEKISQVTGQPIQQIIEIIESKNIHYESNNVHLTQDNIVFFLELG